MHSCGIGEKMQYMTMAYLLHLASILPLPMKFIDPLFNSDKFWQHSFHNSKDALDLLMGPS